MYSARPRGGSMKRPHVLCTVGFVVGTFSLIAHAEEKPAPAAPAAKPATPPPAAPAGAKPPAAAATAPAATKAAPGGTTATWWGHAAWVITTPGGATIAIDPWLDNPVAPKGLEHPKTLDAILLTHGHFDHVS